MNFKQLSKTVRKYWKNKMENKTHGVLYALFAFIFWGLTPIYFKAASEAPAYEILLHRVVWSVVFLFFLLLGKKEFKKAIALTKDKKVRNYLFASSAIIAFNWFIYIWAVEHNKILETSLGYYINPLVTIFFAFLFLKEIPTTMQKVAISLAFIAVCYQLYTLGSFPMVSIILALTFSAYGLLRKKVALQSMVGLFVETIFLLPIALLGWLYLIATNASHFSPIGNPYLALLLVLAGMITVFPLLAFNSATIRLKLSTMGFLHYLSPSVSMILAVFIYDEPLSYEKLITFLLIWLALLLITYDSYIKRNFYKKRLNQKYM